MENQSHTPTPAQADVIPEPTVNGTPAAQVNVERPDTNIETLTLSEINNLLGKNYPSKDKALESLKELNSFVGKRKEDYAGEIRKEFEGSYISKADFETRMFYKDHPELEQHRAVIDAVATSKNVSVAEATNLPELKTLIENASGFVKSQEMKSVITSNPRIQAIRDRGQEVKNLMNTGHSADAGILAAKLVLESLEG